MKNRFILIILLLLLFAGRLAIAGTGYLDDVDEWLYMWIHEHFSSFGHASTWVQCMLDIQGQPPEILIRLFEYLSVLPIASALGKQALHPDVLYFIGLYNIVASLLILYVFYRILLRIGFTWELALTGMVMLGTLFNYNIYTRHIFPYDHALLFQLLAFFIVLDENLTLKKCFAAGILSAIGLTNYYGTIMFVFINGGLIVLRFYKAGVIKKCLIFMLPFALVVCSYELLTQIAGKSYLGFLQHYSTTVNMASYDEGFNYVFRYFWMVEKWWGVVLLILFFAGCIVLFCGREAIRIKQALLLGLVTYVSYGAAVYFTHKLVFHGRVLHVFYPFIIIGVLALFKKQKWLSARLAAILFITFSFINYGFVIKDFNRIGYPRNAIYKFHLFERPGVNFTYYEEMASPVHYFQRSAWHIDSTGPAVLPDGKYALCNLCFNYHYPDSAIHIYPPYPLAKGDSVVFEQLHFQSHPAYMLEYCTREGRNIFLRQQLKIRVIKLNSQR